MTARLASAVDGGELLQLAWTSLAAGVGLVAVFSLMLTCATRAQTERRDGRTAAGLAYGVASAVGAAIVLAAIAFSVATLK